MKRYRPIKAAIESAINKGTTYYSATLDQIIDAYSESDKNCWVLKAFEDEGMEAIDFSNGLFGSKVEDDTLYICVTDGRDIVVEGNPTDPEEALEEYSIEQLSEYIEPASDSIITRYITELEITPPDFDAVALDVIKSGVDFTKMVSDYNEFSI